MGSLIGSRRALLGGKRRYYKKVLRYGPIAYWPLWETSGAVANCLVNPAQNGTYVGVTLGQPGIGDGRTCPLFDGLNDYVNIYTAALAAAWNWNTLTMMIWARIFNVGVWTDALGHYAMRVENADLDVAMICKEGGLPNELVLAIQYGGVWDGMWAGGHSETSWLPFLITVDKGADEMKMFMGGSQVGGTQNTLGVPTGNPPRAANTLIGAAWMAGNLWYGWLAHAAVWNRVLSPTDVAALAVV